MPSQDFDQLHSQIDSAVHTNGPTGKTTAAGLNALLHRLVTDLPAGTSLPADELAALAAASNPNAANPYATRADLASLPTGGSMVVIEQDLTSQSSTSVPSVYAVRSALGTLSTLQTANRNDLVSALNELAANAKSQGVIYQATSNTVNYYPTMQGAMNAAMEGDIVVLRGYTDAQVYHGTACTVYAHHANIGQIVQGFALFTPTHFEWHGGYVRECMYVCRLKDFSDDGTTYQSVYNPKAHTAKNYNIRFGPGAKLLPFARIYGNIGGAVPDQYEFYNCTIDSVDWGNLLRNDSVLKNYISLYFKSCTFQPANGGKVFSTGTPGSWTSLIQPTSLVLRDVDIIASDGIFNNPIDTGILSLQGISNVPLESNVVNMLTNGLQVLQTANKFITPVPAETWGYGR